MNERDRYIVLGAVFTILGIIGWNNPAQLDPSIGLLIAGIAFFIAAIRVARK